MMMTCDKCKYALWQRTSAGRLHPNKQGTCEYKYKIPPLPQSRYFLGGRTPESYGGQIERGSKLKEHCVYYAPAT